MAGGSANTCDQRKIILTLCIRTRKSVKHAKAPRKKSSDHANEKQINRIHQSYRRNLLSNHLCCGYCRFALWVCRMSYRASSNTSLARDPASIRILLQVLSSNVIMVVTHTLATDNTPLDSLLALACWTRHQVVMEICIGWDILQLGLPILEIIFGIVENLTGLVDVLVGWSNISGNNWCIIEEVEESAAMTSKDNLLFGAFDSCSEFSSVCLLQLLACLS